MSFDGPPPSYGDRGALSFEQRNLLDQDVIPTALRWLDFPGLKDHGIQTLTYWGVPIPARHNPQNQEGN